MSEPNTHGGKRAGAGAKPMRGEPKVTLSLKVSPQVKAFLASSDLSASEAVEQTIRKSKDFREWRKSPRSDQKLYQGN